MRALGIIALVFFAGTAVAQDRAQTLADIRQELSVLYVEIQRLKGELNTTGSPQVQTSGGHYLDRLNAIEAALGQLTGKTEELEFRINRIVADGTNRIGDLEFRLVELEGGDLGALGETTTLGGEVETTATPTIAPAPDETNDGIQLATNEKADFDRAQAALDGGDFRGAADLFATFNQTYPGSPLAIAAVMRRGEALDALGDAREAARAYLDAFRLEQQGPLAPEALFRLGRSLGRLGQTNEACVTLAEVNVRFPGSAAVVQAESEMQSIGCS